MANKLLQGYDGFTVHLDGYDETDLLAGIGPTKRHEFFYWTDDGDLAGLRYDQWKIAFMEQQAHGVSLPKGTELWRKRALGEQYWPTPASCCEAPESVLERTLAERARFELTARFPFRNHPQIRDIALQKGLDCRCKQSVSVSQLIGHSTLSGSHPAGRVAIAGLRR